MAGGVEVVDRRPVHGVDRGRPAECPDELGQPVGKHVLPFELAPDRECQRDGGIQVRAADPACEVGGQHDGECPAEDVDEPVIRAERHRLPAGPGQPDDVDGASTQAKQDQHEGAEELGQARSLTSDVGDV